MIEQQEIKVFLVSNLKTLAKELGEKEPDYRLIKGLYKHLMTKTIDLLFNGREIG